MSATTSRATAAAFTPAVLAYFKALKSCQLSPSPTHDEAAGSFFFALPAHIRDAVLSIVRITGAEAARKHGMKPGDADAAAEQSVASMRTFVWRRNALVEEEGGRRPLNDDELDAIAIHVDGILAAPDAQQPPEMVDLVGVWISTWKAAQGTGDEPPTIMARAFQDHDRSAWRAGLGIAISTVILAAINDGFEFFDQRAATREMAAMADAIRCRIYAVSSTKN